MLSALSMPRNPTNEVLLYYCYFIGTLRNLLKVTQQAVQLKFELEQSDFELSWNKEHA